MLRTPRWRRPQPQIASKPRQLALPLVEQEWRGKQDVPEEARQLTLAIKG